MNLKHVRTFVAVAETGTESAAEVAGVATCTTPAQELYRWDGG
jgi:hypothetical protein